MVTRVFCHCYTITVICMVKLHALGRQNVYNVQHKRHSVSGSGVDIIVTGVCLQYQLDNACLYFVYIQGSKLGEDL